MSDDQELYGVLNSFYQIANFWLRIAVLVCILWPLSLVTIAILMTPARAQTIVPVAALSPLLAVVCFVIGFPLALPLLAANPGGKKALTWLAAFIGTELVIGIYFSLVPVSNDTGLVPLLILLAFAILFLRLGKFATGVGTFLMFVALIVTAVFLLGGRREAKRILQSKFAITTVSGPDTAPTVTSTPDPTLNQHCVETADAYHCDTLPPKEFSFQLPLTSQYSKAVYFPTDCATWNASFSGKGWYGYRDPVNFQVYGPFTPYGRQPKIDLHGNIQVEGQQGISVRFTCAATGSGSAMGQTHPAASAVTETPVRATTPQGEAQTQETADETVASAPVSPPCSQSSLAVHCENLSADHFTLDVDLTSDTFSNTIYLPTDCSVTKFRPLFPIQTGYVILALNGDRETPRQDFDSIVESPDRVLTYSNPRTVELRGSGRIRMTCEHF